MDLTDTGESYRLDLRNGVLVHREAPVDGATLILRTTRAALPRLLMGHTEASRWKATGRSWAV